MLKIVCLSLLIFCFISMNAQNGLPNDLKTPKSIDNEKLGGLNNKGHKTFNNIDHPLSIIGGGLTIGGAITYVIASEINAGKQPLENNIHYYSPQTRLQYVGIGVFVTGAILFTIFSTEREKGGKRKKVKQKYNASDWEVQE